MRSFVSFILNVSSGHDGHKVMEIPSQAGHWRMEENRWVVGAVADGLGMGSSPLTPSRQSMIARSEGDTRGRNTAGIEDTARIAHALGTLAGMMMPGILDDSWWAKHSVASQAPIRRPKWRTGRASQDSRPQALQRADSQCSLMGSMIQSATGKGPPLHP